MRSDKLFLAIALAAAAAMAHGASKLTVTADGVNLDGTTLAGGKLTADTAVSEIALNGGTLDLAGYTLTFNGAANKISVAAKTTITATESATLNLSATSGRYAQNFLKDVTFDGLLTVQFSGLATGQKYFLQEEKKDKSNTYTGETIFSNFRMEDNITDINAQASKFPRFMGANLFGNGKLTLKNGTHLFCNTGVNVEHNWSSLNVANDATSTARNILWLENSTTFKGDVCIADNSELVIGTKNGNISWSGNFNEAYGTISLFAGGSGSFSNNSAEGFPNSKICFLYPRDNLTGVSQYGTLVLRFGNSEINNTAKIGALSTDDRINNNKQAMPTLQVCNSTAGTRTLEIGGLGGDSTFYGTLCNGTSSAITAIDKVGNGTLTLGGANTYTGGTTISEGTLELKGEGSLGNGDIKFAGGKLAFASDAQSTDYLERIKNSSTAPVKISVAAGKEIVWNSSLDDSNTMGVEKSGKGTLQLGENFACIQGATLTIEEGELVNHADLSSVTLRVRSDNTVKAKLVNQGKLGPVVLYKVETDGIKTTEVARMDATGKITYAMNPGRAVEIAKLAYKYSNDALASNYDSYFETKVTSNGDNTYTYEITLKDEAKPAIEAGSDGQAATIEDQSIKFNHENMNLKPGLYYAISATTKPDTTQATVYKLYREDDTEFSLSADLPESGVLYYKVLVSDHENGN